MNKNTLFHDQKYIALLEPYLDRFQKLDNDLWNFRCPICGDSEKSKYKARGYFHSHEGIMMMKCWNCHVAMPFYAFLKQFDPSLYRRYSTELFSEQKGFSRHTRPEDFYTDDDKEPEPAKLLPPLIHRPNLRMDCISDLPWNHYARTYVRERKIPENKYYRLYHSPVFVETIRKLFPTFFDVERHQQLEKNKEPRLVLPFYDHLGNLIGLNGRSYDRKSKKRYIVAKAHDDVSKVYGLDEVKPTEQVFVVEGPIDSLFLPNAIATMDGQLHGVDAKTGGLRLLNRVLCPDNQPRNRDVCRAINAAIDAEESIVLWPSAIEQKDINEMITDGGLSIHEILEMIEKNTFRGLSARLRFSRWQKIK